MTWWWMLPLLTENERVALITFVIAPAVVGVVGFSAKWFTNKLHLSDAASEAVQNAVHSDSPPPDVSAAFYLLAHKLEALDEWVDAANFYMLHLEIYAARQNEQLPEPLQRPMPTRPKILRIPEEGP